MTHLTERQAARLAERLADLPRLAADASADGPGGSTVGSAAPPGVNLRAIDAGREQPQLLALLAQCTSVVREEMPAETFERAPDRSERPTWRSESDWLIATMGWWQGNDWCAEWIATEVRTIRYALIALIEQHSHHRTCGFCGAPIEAYRIGDYALAQCSRCERIVGGEDVGYKQRIEAARASFAARVVGA